ncbi:oligosaccharide flippase family protein [Clostridium estertheticum]|uniref:Oligosaccharide flippase family protein n=1 Tax=Clostridium estertheticum TaxID=238834 RepID=A0AA47I6Z4_9CLOT|nr:oligosaccharide flippase family protein [Clostridium estertheticum]MBU3155337.1 oligosaccharide flippase family protein [Clostridium estertheticum]WAG60395.1 oligosaccharide flippase family protein [Clostridium estertheticum]
MNKRVNAFFSMGLVSIFQILSNIIRSKLTAVILGTYGIGVLSVINNILGIGQIAGNLGINNGIVKKISDDVDDKEEIQNVISTSYITSLISSIIILIAMILFSKQISVQNFNNEKYYIIIIIVAFSVPITTFNSIDGAIINGFKEIKVISRVAILTSIINVIASVFFIYSFKLNGAIYSIVAMSVVGYIINFVALKYILCKKQIKFKISLHRYKINIFKTLIAFGSTSIFAALFTNVSMLVIKTAITKKLGMDYNGIFQADWSIMNQYIGIIFTSCGVYYFPTLCSLKTNEERVEEMNKTLEMLLLVIVPVFIAILLFKNIIIGLLYSSKFALSAELLSVFIIGDYFKVIAWTIGYVFAPIYKLREFIIIDFIANVFFTVSSILLLNKFGSLYGIAYAYVALNILLCIIYYIYLKKNINFEFKSYTRKNMLLSFAILTCSYVVIEILNIKFLYKAIILFVILGVWAKLVIDEKKLIKIKKYINKKVHKN